MNRAGFMSKIKRLGVALSMAMTFTGICAEGTGGTWNGELAVTPQVKLNLVFHISEPGAEPAVITMDSPDQGAYGLPTEVQYLSADSVSLAVPTIHMSFSGSLDGGKLKGTFTQGGLKLPLELAPGDVALNRPQTPVPPFPYRTENLTIENPDAHVTLAGTLTIPDGAAKSTPLVVMVTGSGLQNRDEELFGHKPFAVIADYLARNGVASFRYDDRGFGESTGDPKSITTADNASDAAAVMKYLRDTGRFGKTGILGHSEGGIVGYMLGAREAGVPDFIVSLAGPAVRGDSILIYQNRHGMTLADVPAQMLDDYLTALRKVLTYRIDNPGKEITDDIIEEFCPGWSALPVYSAWSSGLKSTFGKPNAWLDYFMAYSPAHDLGKVTSPMLIIYGGKDVQVPAELNAPAARALAPAADVKVYPELNHPMQHATTGEIAEYSTIEETIAPEVLSDILKFITSLK